MSEAIAIIAGDDAHDTFGRTFSFVQVARDTQKDRARRTKQLRCCTPPVRRLARHTQFYLKV